MVWSIILTMVQFTDLSAQDGEYTVYYYDDGSVSSEGYLLEGKPNGYWTTYYPSGQVKSEGNRKSFQLDSTWVFYNEDGALSSKINYDKGIKSGEVLTYQSGVLYERAILENDKREGIAEIYFPTGEVQKRIPFVNDLEEGEGFEYARDGRVITLLKYSEGYLKTVEKINRMDKRGKRRGKWVTFHPNGLIHVEGTYMNDKKNGIFKTFDKRGDLISLEKYRDDRLVVDSEESVILDLRNNPGGLLNEAVNVSSVFLDEGVVVSVRQKDETERVLEVNKDIESDTQIPLLVLINKGSASASEIVAGAVKDYDRAKLMGTTTFGKGVVQSVVPLKDGSAVSLTTARYYTPDGNYIHEKGIEPGTNVELDLEAAQEDGSDKQLDKALEEMENMIFVRDFQDKKAAGE